MKKTFYVKQGRRYVPVQEYDSDIMDAMPYGTHLTVVRQNGQSRRYDVDPAVAPFAAAAVALEQELTQVIQNACAAQPERKPLTEEQRAAWEHFRNTMGDELGMIRYPSMADVARDILNVIQEEVEKQMTNPTVKYLYEQFVTTLKLSKESS